MRGSKGLPGLLKTLTATRSQSLHGIRPSDEGVPQKLQVSQTTKLPGDKIGVVEAALALMRRNRRNGNYRCSIR